MNGMNHRTIRPARRDRRGAALLLALGLLAVFSVLGAAYFKYMSIESDLVEMDVQKMRARFAAEGGIRLALGELLDLQARGEPLENALGEIQRSLPVYGMTQTERTPGGRVGRSPQPLDNLGSGMTVQVTKLDPDNLSSEDPAAPSVRAAAAEGGAFFRLAAEGVAAHRAAGREYWRSVAHVDAVVLLKPQGHEIVYWNGADRPDNPDNIITMTTGSVE